MPTDFTFLPSIASTVTESSARLATSANVPAWLIAIAGSLLTGLDGADLSRRRRGQVDDVDLIVGDPLQGVAVLNPVERIGHERDVLIRGYRKIDRRARNRVHQRQIYDDLRLSRVGYVDDGHRVLARRVGDGLARVLIERHLLVVAGDQELRSGRIRRH